MKRAEALQKARIFLATKQIEDASLESELLLRHTLGINRARLLTESDAVLTPRQEKEFWKNIERRMSGEPSAYITGRREFFGLDFEVNSSTLIPRPETELLVEKTIEFARKYNSPTIVDIGTGCGAIAVSLAVKLPDAIIYATDVSEKALKLARRNAGKHNVSGSITFLHGHLLNPLRTKVDVIVANLPYVRTKDLATVNTAGFEPLAALDGGVDGLDTIKELCLQAQDKLLPDGALLLEIGMGQSEILNPFLVRAFPDSEIIIFPDLTGIERVVAVSA